MPERQREAHDRDAGVVHALVELLGPQPHLGAAERVGGLERRIGKAFVEIFVDDIRFRHDDIAVDQRRHHRARIELDVPSLLMLAGAQIEMPAFPFEAFLGQQSRTFCAQLDISL